MKLQSLLYESTEELHPVQLTSSPVYSCQEYIKATSKDTIDNVIFTLAIFSNIKLIISLQHYFLIAINNAKTYQIFN